MNKSVNRLQSLKIFFLVFFAFLSLLSLFRIISNTISSLGATDFHSYWYSGLFVREGKDPFEAYFKNIELNVPIKFLDGKHVSTPPVAQAGLAITPANTAPIILIMTLFSYFSWPVAKILWMVCNLLLISVIPILSYQLYHADRVVRNNKWLLFFCLSFWALLATRNAAGNGQTSLIVLFLMILSVLLAKKNWIISGVVLGIALSKYSMVISIILYLMYKKEFRIIIIALLTQAIGLLMLSFFTSSSPLQIIDGYYQIMISHSGMHGVNLTALFPNNRILALAIPIVFTIIIFGLTGLTSYFSRGKFTHSETNMIDFHILNILILWSLLVVYHREYDVVVYILFVEFIVLGVIRNRWLLTKNQNYGLLIIVALFTIWLCRPGTISLSFLPPQIANMWLDLSSKFVILILLISLAILLTLIVHFRSKAIVSIESKETKNINKNK